ncbi:MAG: hypothetical protein OHK0039_25330 [Bacteroidia bacterium]
MRFFLLSLLLLLAAPLAAQDDTAAPKLKNHETLDPLKYPGKALRQSAEGTVVLEVEVDEQGRYLAHNFVSSASPLLDAAIEPYAPLLAFYPARQQGVAVPGIARIQFIFEIEKKVPRKTSITIKY